MVKDKFIIGLTGRSGSGKGYACSVFAELGVSSVDTDAVYRQMTGAPDGDTLSPCMEELVREFGETILSPDRSLNRRVLADIVFAEGARDKLETLNSLTHKHILAQTECFINERFALGDEAVIVDAPMLFESGFDSKCDFILVCDAPYEVILERIIARDGIEREAAERRLASQMTREEYVARADYIINTDAHRGEIMKRAESILCDMRRAAASKS